MYRVSPKNLDTLHHKQVRSKQRVADHGEVYTHPREVNAMLDLVKQETERIDSRFLEPACGNGNFLVEILNRKLVVVAQRYAKSQLDYERYAVLAISSIYGIDILADNIAACQIRLFEIFDAQYTAIFKNNASDACRNAARHILRCNILQGDALTLQTVGENPQPIIFPECSAFNGSQLKRRDFVYRHLVEQASLQELPLFSDLDEAAYIPEPIKEYPLIHFLKVNDAD